MLRLEAKDFNDDEFRINKLQSSFDFQKELWNQEFLNLYIKN